MLKGGGGTKRFEEVLTRELEVLAIVMGGGGREKSPTFKRGAQNVLPFLEVDYSKLMMKIFLDSELINFETLI